MLRFLASLLVGMQGPVILCDTPGRTMAVQVGSVVAEPPNWPESWPLVVVCGANHSLGPMAAAVVLDDVSRPEPKPDVTLTLISIRRHFRDFAEQPVELALLNTRWRGQSLSAAQAAALLQYRDSRCAQAVLERRRAGHVVSIVTSALYFRAGIKALWPNPDMPRYLDRMRVARQVAERLSGTVMTNDAERVDLTAGPLAITIRPDPSDEA